MCIDVAFHGGSNDIIGGRCRLRRPEISPINPFNFLLSLAAPHLHGVLVLVTGDKFIAGVVVTANNWSPVSTINLSPVSTTPAITEIRDKDKDKGEKFIAGVVDTGDKFFAGVVDTAEQLFASVVYTAEQLFAGVIDTGDKH